MAEFGYLAGNGIELILCRDSSISYPLHNHVSVFTLGFLLEGEIELVTDRGREQYRRDGAFLIPPYTPHCINARSRYTLLSLCVRKDWVAGTELREALPEISAFLREAIGQPELEAKITRALGGLIWMGPLMPAEKETAVSRLKTQLERHPERRCSLDDMAGMAFRSKYDFIRTFQHEVGLTPHRFQIQNRIRKAQRLLKGPATITEVALATGFCDQSHFIRHFEKIVGLTPTDYRLACGRRVPLSGDQTSAGINLANR